MVPALDVCRSGPRGPAVYVRRVYLLDMDRVGVRFFLKPKKMSYNFFDNEKNVCKYIKKIFETKYFEICQHIFVEQALVLCSVWSTAYQDSPRSSVYPASLSDRPFVRPSVQAARYLPLQYHLRDMNRPGISILCAGHLMVKLWFCCLLTSSAFSAI